MDHAEKHNELKKKKTENGSLSSIFMHADGVDMGLMFLGLIGAFCNGISTGIIVLYVSRMLNTIGNAPSLGSNIMLQNLNRVSLSLSTNMYIKPHTHTYILYSNYLTWFFWVAEYNGSVIRGMHVMGCLFPW